MAQVTENDYLTEMYYPTGKRSFRLVAAGVAIGAIAAIALFVQAWPHRTDVRFAPAQTTQTAHTNP